MLTETTVHVRNVGRVTSALRVRPEGILQALTALEAPAIAPRYEQLSLFSPGKEA